MARRAGGWLLSFRDEGPDGGYRDRIERFGHFSYVVHSGEPIKARQLCIISLQDKSDSREPLVEFVALATRGPKVASFERRIRVTNFVQFEPVSLEDLRAAMPSRVRANVGLGSVGEKTFAACMAALMTLRPWTRDRIERLQESLLRIHLPSDRAKEIIAQERDSVALALGMSRFDRRSLTPWGLVNAGRPFLEALTQAVAREDQMVQHDSTVFGSWRLLSRHQVGAAVFQDRGERLTVINVNRHPVEKSLGVDLVYYTYRYDAFVLVQYKSLRREEGGWTYRPDDQLAAEMKRMKTVPTNSWSGALDDFRLTAEPCFMKLCKPILEEPLAEGMIQGWYLPVTYWEALVASDRTRGAKGGVVVKPETLGRYLNNSQFVDLVGRGWLGSRGKATRSIETVVEVGLEQGRSLVLAAHQRVEHSDEASNHAVDDILPF